MLRPFRISRYKKLRSLNIRFVVANSSILNLIHLKKICPLYCLLYVFYLLLSTIKMKQYLESMSVIFSVSSRASGGAGTASHNSLKAVPGTNCWNLSAEIWTKLFTLPTLASYHMQQLKCNRMNYYLTGSTLHNIVAVLWIFANPLPRRGAARTQDSSHVRPGAWLQSWTL